MVTHPGDLFDIVMDVSITLGLIIASPVIVWQVWGFLSPALYRHEKKVVIPALIGAALLFLAGMALAFQYVLPVTLGFFMSFQSDAAEIVPTVHEYMGFVISMCLAFGAVFELPILIVLLTALGTRAAGVSGEVPSACVRGLHPRRGADHAGTGPHVAVRADDSAVPVIRGVDHAFATGQVAPRQAHRLRRAVKCGDVVR